MSHIDVQQPPIENHLKGVLTTDDEKKKYQFANITRKTEGNIVHTNRELKAEEFAWYFLFPYGKNGLRESRPVAITSLDYFQGRVMGEDTRFQRNDYLFYALSTFERDQITRTINYVGKNIKHGSGEVEDIQFYMKKLRGSSAYWTNTFYDIIALIRCLGTPHYFMTLSCNDFGWLDMRKALLIADGQPNRDPRSLNSRQAQNLVEKYPVVVERHFMYRVHVFMDYLTKDPKVLGGKVSDHFFRIEFQRRGSPHVHMILWLENMPDLKSDEGIAIIDRVVTCELPEDPNQRRLVETYQRHSHSSYCKTYFNNNRNTEAEYPSLSEEIDKLAEKNLKSGKVNRKITSNNSDEGECRFAFPRQVTEFTRIVEPGSKEAAMNGGRICILRRKKEEEFINNYNLEILMRWQGNMDIQVRFSK